MTHPMTHPMPRHRRATRILSAAALSLTVALGAGCASAPQPTDYAQQQPKLDFRAYFNGPVSAQGLFTDRDGRVVKRFSVAMMGRWEGQQGVLEEDFTYSDGTRERRVWRLTDLGGGRFEGRADDIVGVAVGESSGNALRWRYTMKVPVDGRVIEFQFDDWMYQMDARTMLNKASMRKFGITVGEVTLSFLKP